MSTTRSNLNLTRRTTLAGLAAGGLGVAVGGRRSGTAQEMSLADHPMTGMWLALGNPPRRGQDPQFPAPSLFATDGTVILGFVPAEIGMEGDIQFTGSPMGVWEPHDDHTAHFTVVQVLADKTGKLVGTVTIDGHPSTDDGGLTFSDDGVLNTVTIRDAAGAVLTVIPPGTAGTPVTGIRMRVGNAGFSGEENATPVP